MKDLSQKLKLGFRIALALGGLFVCLTSLPGADQPNPQSPADAAWHSYQGLRFDPNKLPEFASDEIARQWLSMNYVARAAAAWRFYERFPDDERRWQAAVDYVTLVLTFITDSDESEKTKAQRLKDEVKNDPRVPQKVSVRIWAADASKDLQSRLDQNDLKEARKAIDDFGRRFPLAEQRAALEQKYLAVLAGKDAPVAKAWVGKLLTDSNPKVVEVAQAWRRKWEVEHSSLEMKFTALDGREVDLAKWRGKVVLIDFWATWCVPCLAELPNLKACYEKFHSRGFEVIGIALDSETARQKLLALIRDKGLPWPQHFDGKHMHNQWAEKFAIESIPTVWLLNKEGVVVSKDARGPGLEELIQRELQVGQ